MFEGTGLREIEFGAELLRRERSEVQFLAGRDLGVFQRDGSLRNLLQHVDTHDRSTRVSQHDTQAINRSLDQRLLLDRFGSFACVAC